jgi:hypothetical protein
MHVSCDWRLAGIVHGTLPGEAAHLLNRFGVEFYEAAYSLDKAIHFWWAN